MTDTDLRDLFHAAGGDLDGPDPVAIDRAWRDGSRRRAGARAAVVGSIAATAAAVTGVAVLGGPPAERSEGPATQSPTPAPASPSPTESGPSTTYAGAPVWVASGSLGGADLPLLEGTGLPVEIDVSADLPPVDGIDRAVGVLGVSELHDGAELSRVVVVGSDGAVRSLAIDGRLERVTDDGGNTMSPLSPEGLSPDGARVFFRQESKLVVYEFGTGTWSEIPTPRWTAETAQWTDGGIFVPREPWGSDGTVYGLDGARLAQRHVGTDDWDGGEAYGPERAAANGDIARSYFLTNDAFAGTNSVVVSVEGRPRLLVHDADELGGKMCCPVAGWLAPAVVAFQSGQDLLAWKVPGGGVHRVSEVVGLEFNRQVYVASWAFRAR